MGTKWTEERRCHVHTDERGRESQGTPWHVEETVPSASDTMVVWYAFSSRYTSETHTCLSIFSYILILPFRTLLHYQELLVPCPVQVTSSSPSTPSSPPEEQDFRDWRKVYVIKYF